ncbi:unnamed protein product [Caenorhabditis angaria]|uniref:Peptidase M13 C-terminal domain-containing protein n=1 Tax=Caenorhabditis angaria TaxID=860376 RepID=A0A9P1ID48_9PELO|nr:unnamed protein product [Caenorhabditis angaria]
MDLKTSAISKPNKIFEFQKYKKWIIVGIIFLAIVFIFYANNQGWIQGLENVPNSRPNIQKNENICRTKECKMLGKRMKSMMNPKINPCDDFYESVCGNYPKNDSQEMFKYSDEDYNDLSKFIKTYKPVTKSEKVAMTVLKKCMDKSEYRNQIDMSFWDDLESHSLTDVLIEAVKVNPIDTGFLKNYVAMIQNSTTNSKYLFLDIIHGFEKNTTMRNRTETILSENEHLNEEVSIPIDEAKRNIKFFDVERYVKNLLPEKYRDLENNGEWFVELNSMVILEKIVEEFGVEEVKKAIRDKYKSTIKFYLVQADFDTCFKRLNKLFPGTLATIFVKHFVGDKNLYKVNKLFKDVQKVFIEMIEENSWMDQKLKDVLIQEVLDLKSSIGIPDEYRNQENIDRMYSRIGDFENQPYLELIRNLLKMNSEETFLRVSRREEITYLGETTDINANYLPLNHRTSIGPLFLNYPYVDQNLPEWNTIATIGHVMAHEVGHAFDSKYFFISPMDTNVEMPIRVKEIFRNRIKCIIQKYNKYQFADGTFSNGTFTQQEDSADMIGFNLAYRLFKKLDKLEKLPYLDEYSAEQQYFQRMGYLWCFSTTDEEFIELVKEDEHSLPKFRINGMMSNFEEFAKAFNCPKNSPMNPEKKCPLFK